MFKRARFLTPVLLGAVLFAPGAAGAQGNGKMPPGMTPQMMKTMMTPGPAHPHGIPRGSAPWAGCIPSMGYHYVKPANIPFGPIYGWYQGKPIFTEIMVSKKDFDRGSSWNEQLKPLPGYAIDHVDIWYEERGHPGYAVPHYDIHAWYISHARHMRFCGNTSGKKPAFV
ncbi:MAG: hypothetical protein ABR591_13650 [Candidatus Velthaea sp.]